MNITSPLIWRLIVKREYFTSHHARFLSGLSLTLNCGHTKRCKASQAPKRNKVRCQVCESLKQQKTGSIWPTLLLQEIWDETAQMPKLVPWKDKT